MARAAGAVFSSNSATTPAVSARNASSGSGAKAVFGNAAAATGTGTGVYGRSASAHGYGVYSAGRLGSSGALVCAHCVTGADIRVDTVPQVPSAAEAARLGGHLPAYYARVVPLSWVGPTDATYHRIADVAGLGVYGMCTATGGGNLVQLYASADTAAGTGTMNIFVVEAGGTAIATGYPVGTAKVELNKSLGTNQDEGRAIYRDDATGRIVTIENHTYGANCEVFGDVITTG
jgi:hypothetical protein